MSDRVDAVSADGTPITIPEDKVPELERSHGHLASPAETAAFEHAKRLQKYSLRGGGVLGALEGIYGPAAAGAYRGITLGLSDVALSALSPEVRQKLNEYREISPLISGVEEFTGSAATMIAAGELVPGSSSVAGRLIAGAARGAIESEIYGAGKAASEAALNDDAIGEKVRAGLGHHALLGAGLGLGFGALGEGVSALRGAASRARAAAEPVAAAEAASVEPEVRGLLGPRVLVTPPSTPDSGFAASTAGTYRHRITLDGEVHDMVLGNVGQRIDRPVPADERPIRFRVDMRAPQIDPNLKPGTRDYRRAMLQRGMAEPTEAHAVPYLRDDASATPLRGMTDGARVGDAFDVNSPASATLLRGMTDGARVGDAFDVNSPASATLLRGMTDGGEAPAFRISAKGPRPRVVIGPGELEIPVAKPGETLPSAEPPPSLAEQRAARAGRVAPPIEPEVTAPEVIAPESVVDSGMRPPSTTRDRVAGRPRGAADDARTRGPHGTKEHDGHEWLHLLHHAAHAVIEAEAGVDVEDSRGQREMIEAVNSALDDGTEKQGAMLDALDKAKAGIVPDATGYIRAMRRDVLSKYYATNGLGGRVVAPGTEHVVDTVEKFLGSMERATLGKPPSFRQWFDWRRNLDALSRSDSQVPLSAKFELQRMRGMMEDRLDTAGEAAAKTQGGSFLPEYRANQKTLQALVAAKVMLEAGAAGGVPNNVSGQRTTLTSGLGSVVGSMLGGRVGGLAGAGPGVLAGKSFRDRGDMLAADLLGRIADTISLRQVAARTETQLSRGVGELVEKRDPLAIQGPRRVAPPTAIGVRLTGDRRKNYQLAREELARLVSNPTLVTNRIATALDKLPGINMQTQSAVIMTTLGGLNFLATKLPPEHANPYSLQPLAQPRARASDTEISKFLRYATAVDDPLIVLREAKKGTLTRDHVEAVKEVYPKLYDDMRGQVVRRLADSKTLLPYSRRIQLGILLDIPTDATLAPDFKRAIQATFTGDEKAGAESPPPHLAHPINIAGPTQTANQAAAERVPYER